MVVQEYKAKTIKLSEEQKTLYIVDEYGHQYIFKFTFYCKANATFIAFNMETKAMLAFYRSYVSDGFACVSMKFWLDENEMPKQAASYFTNWSDIVANIYQEFKEKHASYQLDSIINS